MVELYPAANSPIAQIYLDAFPKESARATEAD
jgi:hypothetical protein